MENFAHTDGQKTKPRRRRITEQRPLFPRRFTGNGYPAFFFLRFTENRPQSQRISVALPS